jgi:flagellar basal-body rod protein FlgC
MNYMAAFEISASGMTVERVRLDTTAVNLANANSTRSLDGTTFRPLRVLSGPKMGQNFSATMDAFSAARSVPGVQVNEIRPLDVAPRLVFEPAHPDADEKGFVAYPGINPVAEMVNLITTMRTYEANVVAMNAAKTMALKALDIGGNG